jgi:signal transduction histidine kinase
LLLLDSTIESCWAEVLAQEVLQSRKNLLVEDTRGEERWRKLQSCQVGAAISLPLIAEDGQVVGALSVVSRQQQVFSSADARHLSAFGIQACVAIRNAELHSQVRSQWAMLEAVLRDLGDGLVIYDQHGKAVFANPVAQRFLTLGEEPNELQQQVERLVDEVRGSSTQIMWREVQGMAETLDSPPVYQAIASQARVGDDATSHVAVVLHDVTIKKAEEKARNQFISMVSHELRNPLHTLSGFLKVVLQGRAGALNPVQQDFLQTAEEQVDKLNGRINELLEFNRLQGGRMRLERDWGHMPTLATATLSALTLQAEQAGLTLVNEVPAEMPDILMDSKRIGQVLTNLIENAIKATPPSGVIQVRARIVEEMLQVSVRDTGVGIAEGDIQRIFDPFYSTANRSHYGVHLGLGLAICQQIIQGHGGHIWVESSEGKGTTFSFTLPLVAHEHELEVAS